MSPISMSYSTGNHYTCMRVLKGLKSLKAHLKFVNWILYFVLGNEKGHQL